MDTETTVSKETSVVETPTSTEHVVTTKVAGDPVEFSLFKMNQIVWYIVGLILIVIALRFIFLLLGAGNTGFVMFIYSVSGVFVSPFYGIFGQPVFGQSVMETASLVAMLVYVILGFVINGLIGLFSKNPS